MKGVLQQALLAALSPALNTMSVVGLVSIPEFMSGQLAGGQSPMQVRGLSRTFAFLPSFKSFSSACIAVVCQNSAQINSIPGSGCATHDLLFWEISPQISKTFLLIGAF